MWNPFKKKAPSNEHEYTFIWYWKMNTKGVVNYTQPFRTKVTAPTAEEAFVKLKSFIDKKMTLCVVDEKDYNKDELGIIQNKFDDLNKKMNDFFDKLK